jgi:hypothetical protein
MAWKLSGWFLERVRMSLFIWTTPGPMVGLTAAFSVWQATVGV